MKRSASAKFLHTEQGLVLILGIAIVCIVAYFALAWHAYDPRSSMSFGIQDNTAHIILEAFTPILAATGFGLRNVFLRDIGQDIPHVALPGIGRLYVVTLFGVGVAFAAVVYASIGTSDSGIKLFIEICAAVWAATVTYVLEKFLKAGRA